MVTELTALFLIEATIRSLPKSIFLGDFYRYCHWAIPYLNLKVAVVWN